MADSSLGGRREANGGQQGQWSSRQALGLPTKPNRLSGSPGKLPKAWARLSDEFNIEKLQLVEVEKKKIRQEFDRKSKQVEVRKKIEYSMQLNASRIKVLQAQDDVVNEMKDSARKELLGVANNRNVYKKLLKGLIVQSLLRLKEPSVLLRCREIDVVLVESVLDDAKHEYIDKAGVHAPKITIDKRVYLPPPPSSEDSHGPSW
ncbi:hypothetical protein CsSME_00017749 [Camellia sinensis var. sinensis]